MHPETGEGESRQGWARQAPRSVQVNFRAVTGAEGGFEVQGKFHPRRWWRPQGRLLESAGAAGRPRAAAGKPRRRRQRGGRRAGRRRRRRRCRRGPVRRSAPLEPGGFRDA